MNSTESNLGITREEEGRAFQSWQKTLNAILDWHTLMQHLG